jgi:hypothetical protein
MTSSTAARSSAARRELTSDTTTNVFSERSTWGFSPIEVTTYGDTERKFITYTGAMTSATPIKFHEFTIPSTSTSAPMMGWKLFWEHEKKFDEAEREALIATVIDSIIAARDNPFSGLRSLLDGISKPLESESTGFVYVPEGASLAPTVWSGSSTYRPSTTTDWYSSTREGTFTTLNWEY